MNKTSIMIFLILLIPKLLFASYWEEYSVEGKVVKILKPSKQIKKSRSSKMRITINATKIRKTGGQDANAIHKPSLGKDIEITLYQTKKKTSAELKKGMHLKLKYKYYEGMVPSGKIVSNIWTLISVNENSKKKE